MADDAHRQGEVDAEGGDQKHKDHSGGKREVLPEDFFGVAGDAEEDRDVFEFVAHQNDIGRLHGDIGARGPHGHADIGGRERGGVVHAVPDHHHAAVLFEFLNGRNFGLG